MSGRSGLLETPRMVGQFSRTFESARSGAGLAGFLGLALLVRFGTFLISAMDWDESLYILGAEALLKGHLPYLQVWDHKPPGIFAVFAGIIALIGDSVFAVRLLAGLAVGLTAWCLSRLLATADGESTPAGLCAGVLYVLFSLGNDGTSANTELFYMAFVSSALLLVAPSSAGREGLLEPPSWGKAIAAGILLGIAGSINYLALLYSLPLAAFIAFSPFIDAKRPTHRGSVLFDRILRILAVAAGPVLVFALVIATYGLAQSLDDFVYANVTANRAYVSAQPYDLKALAAALGNQFSGQWFLWLCVLLLPFVLRAGTPLSWIERRVLLLAGACLLIGFIAVTTSRLYWAHYFLQWNPALCLVSGIVVSRLIDPLLSRSAVLAVCAFLPLALGATYNLLRDNAKSSVSVLLNRYVKGQANWGDVPAQVGEYIRQRIREGDYIYVVDYSPIIYSKAGAALPTRYVFPPFLIGAESSRLLDTDPHRELARILRLEPRYIVRKRVRPDPQGTLDSYYAQLDVALASDYRLEQAISGIDLYRRSQ